MVVVQSTADHTLSVRQMDTSPPSLASPFSSSSSSSSLPALPAVAGSGARRRMRTLTISSDQNTEDGTAHDLDLATLERSTKDPPLPDPFALSTGYKSEADLASMRKAKRGGKDLESYHRQQNEVRAPRAAAAQTDGRQR